MGTLLTKLNKKNIQITLIGNTDLDVIAPDELWDNGLEDYLTEYKQQLISELVQDKHVSDIQEETENTELQKPATTATIATKCMNSAVPVATSLLQVATIALNTNMQQDATIALQPTAPTLDLTKQADQKLNCIFIDFETRSEADLEKVGSILYSEHPSTDILCVAILDASSNDKPIILTNEDIKTQRKMITGLVENDKNVFVAHNAAFEQAIWINVLVKKYGYPEIPIERWRCTMAKAYAHGLSGSLKDAANALNLPIQKDMEGRKNMIVLSKPKKGGGFWTPDEQPEMFENLYSYCKTDIEVTQLIDSTLPDLSDKEQQVWVIDQRMNQEGIYIDLDMVKKANNLADNHKLALEKRLQEITNGAVEKPTQGKRLLSWLQTNGVMLKNAQEATITKSLNNGNLPAEVKEVLLIRQEGMKSSLAKYKKMLDRVDGNGRIRGDLLQYHAAHTGRWGGRGIQLHNLPKPEIDLGVSCEAISTLDYDNFSDHYGTNVANVLSQSIRGTIIPSIGKKFFIGDFAQFEARIIAWLAGEQKAVEAFARGEDLYCIEASKIYGRPITKEEDKEERQVGKVAVLALGYQGGISAFANMAKQAGISLDSAYDNLWTTATEDEKDKAKWSLEQYLKNAQEPISEKEALIADVIKQRWRASNSSIVEFWHRQYDAAVAAVVNGQSDPVGGLHWFMHKQFLYCKLPSGRCMAYPYPEVEPDRNGKSLLSYLSIKGREDTYGGKLAENVVQAVQRDLLVDAILRLEDSPYKVIFHVHDEIVAEGEPELNLDEFKSLMRQVPEWASGLPIDVDARISDRFC